MYHCVWEVFVEADSHGEAAQKARACQTRPGAAVTSFQITDQDSDRGETIQMDVIEQQPEPATDRKRETPVCPRCKSDNVLIDACAEWNDDDQCFEMVGTQDAIYCRNCECDSDYAEWVEAKPAEAA